MSSERGSSLVEVVVAIVILGLVGFSFFNGMTTNNQISTVSDQSSIATLNLNSAAQVLASLPFENCSRDLNQTPYVSKFRQLIPDTQFQITAWKIPSDDPASNTCSTFTPVGVNSNGVLISKDRKAALVQLIEVSQCLSWGESNDTQPSNACPYPETNIPSQKTYKLRSTYVTKLSGGATASPGSVQVAGQTYSCGIFDGGTNTFTLSSSPSSTSSYFIFPPGAPSGFSTSLTGSALSLSASQGSVVDGKVDLSSLATNRAVLDVGGFDQVRNYYLKPTTVSSYVWPRLSYLLDYPSPVVIPTRRVNFKISAFGGGGNLDPNNDMAIRFQPSSWSGSPSFTLTRYGADLENTALITWSGSSATLDSQGEISVPIDLALKWYCWNSGGSPIPAANLNTGFDVVFRKDLALRTVYKNSAGQEDPAVTSCTAFRTSNTPCRVNIYRTKQYGTEMKKTGSNQGWYLTKVYAKSVTGGVESNILYSGTSYPLSFITLSSNSAWATTTTDSIERYSLDFSYVSSGVCKTGGSNPPTQYRVYFEFTDKYYPNSVASTGTNQGSYTASTSVNVSCT